MLKLDFFFLSPVQVVKVTSQNLQEVAEWCGGKVATTESRRVPGRQDSYVWVPTPKGTAISWAFPGMFITKRLVRTVKDEMRVTYAVFRRDYFEKNYFGTPQIAVSETWEKGISTPNTKKAGKKIEKLIESGEEVPGVAPTMENVVDALHAAGITTTEVAPIPYEEYAVEAVADPDTLDRLRETSVPGLVLSGGVTVVEEAALVAISMSDGGGYLEVDALALEDLESK